MSLLHRELAWLCRPPADFRLRCRRLAQGEADVADLQRLAGAGLDNNQLIQLASIAAAWRRAGHDLEPLAPFRLAVVGNGTTSFIAPALAATGLRYGLALDVVEASFDQAMQECIDPTSALQRAAPDAVLVALDHRGLSLQAAPGDPEQEQRAVDEALERLRAIRSGLHRSGRKITAILQTVASPPEALFGSFDRRLPGALFPMIETLNTRLARELDGSGDALLDVARLASVVGVEAWHDPRQWALAKFAFAQEYVPLYADHVCRLVAALRGRARRCLVLDLDNTLWSGVIGDDGLEGIRVGQGDPIGESFLEVQRFALALRDRGIVLAVVSKNDDAVARQPFRSHPDMLLREEHIAVFQANWEDKAANITAVAEHLGLGLDTVVFLDDNPAERELIRQKLPAVAVPELPNDPALYARTLAAAGYFEATAFSYEDRRRAADYQSNAQRLQLREAATDLDGYLRSLSMILTVAPFDAVSRARIAQLINKSNQFNLTTRRYTEQEVALLESDPSVFTMQVRLADRFGDLGMISVVICRRAGRRWLIDTWLMSCRVLRRRVEEAVLAELVRAARRAGVEELRGTYLPSGRNGMVARHFAELGFTFVETRPDGSTEWRLDVDTAAERDVPIEIRSSDPGSAKPRSASPHPAAAASA